MINNWLEVEVRGKRTGIRIMDYGERGRKAYVGLPITYHP
jgi:hypothetical protein